MSKQTRVGTLRWRTPDAGVRRLYVEEPTGQFRRVADPSRDLVPDLRGLAADELAGRPVDFEWRKGQPRAIRDTGTPLPERAAPTAASSSTDPARGPARAEPQPAGHRPLAAPLPPLTPAARDVAPLDAFHNPYTFIPAAPRDQTTGDLADRAPTGHDRLRPHLWSGRIGVTLTVATPLLLLDSARATPSAENNQHLTFPPLRRNGAPHLPSTAVRGMLRTAYEAVTNSRLGVFVEHDARLAYRMPARGALRMVPARVNDSGDALELLPGTTPVGRQAAAPTEALHAAWLPRYGPALRDRPAAGAPQNIRHRQRVDALVELVQHHRWDRRRREHLGDFRFWTVRAVVFADSPLPSVSPLPDRGANPNRSYYRPLGDLRQISGWAFISNENINRKHDERVFFADPPLARSVPLTELLRRGWQDVVRSYREAHRPADITGRQHNGRRVGPDVCCGPEPGRTAWSPHQYEPNAERLNPGDVCYARIDSHGNVDGLFPVTIAREPFTTPPDALLPRSLQPARVAAELSPADRVFGWVNPAGRGAYRGNLRVGPVRWQDHTPGLREFGAAGVPLAILGQPKPQQGRFYLGDARPDGPRPLITGLPKENLYSPGQALRGRKVYRHHAGLPDDYWDDPEQDRTQQQRGGRYQEYRRPCKEVPTAGPLGDLLTSDGRAFRTIVGTEQRDSQNRSITAWVEPGAEFTAAIDVRNLTSTELGALLWLITLDDRYHHRLGLGKPLGFGSVHLALAPEHTDLRTGSEWVAYYRSLIEPDRRDPAGAAAAVNTAVTAFLDELGGAQPALRTPQLAAFLTTAEGDPDVPVHYPRVRPGRMPGDTPVPPDPRGQAYEWFVQNEQQERGTVVHGRGLSLPDSDGPPLRVHPARERGGRA